MINTKGDSSPRIMIESEPSLLNYNVTWEPNGVLVQISGIVTFEEAFMVLQKILTDKRLRRCRYRIYNLLGIQRIEHDDRSLLSQAAISKAGTSILRQNRHQIAFVARNSTRHQELFQLYSETMSSPTVQLRFFQNIEDARIWTGSI